MANTSNFPPQTLPFSKKTKAWRKKCVLWAQNKTFFNYSLVRKTITHKKINYDLLNGKLHMNDLQMILNPNQLKTNYIPDQIQHYSIMNAKLNVLRGEEIDRVFDYRVIVTNPTAISEIENEKKSQLFQEIQKLVQDQSASEDEFNQRLEKMSDFFTYEWQDLREIRANALLTHYVKEYNMPLIFNQGFMDAMTVGEEIYKCDIVGGEPTLERINPMKIRVFKSGYSNRIEDADVIILEDYWSPGKVIDTFYDVLSDKDIKYIQDTPDYVGQGVRDSMDNIDERYGYVRKDVVDETLAQSDFYFDPTGLFGEGINSTLLPYDIAGNLRVLQVYWKSRRKIKKIKSYDQETGEEVFNFFPETYVTNFDEGEEEQIFWINEAWEGTMIGQDIFINIRPRLIQYNRLSNPSRCHFGIIGSIYNLNDTRPFSMVDMMKPYNYLYDAVHAKVNKLIENNWGKIIQLDLAKVPKGWEIDKWMYYAKVNNLAVVDSFKEGNIGAATGKLAGGLNNAQSGVIDAEMGNSIQSNLQLLQFIKEEMAEVCGISRQREGQISNRETVGGVERSTLQSSHITEWIFSIHDDLKRRVLECFLETAKIAMRGRSKKFQYILSDGSMKVMDIDGDEFSEADYGLVVDNSRGTQELNQKLDTLAQAALQNQTLSFASIMKLYTSGSIAEKMKMVENDENKRMQMQQQQQQQQLQQQQQIAQMQSEQRDKELQQQAEMNQADNETKVLIANINAEAQMQKQAPDPNKQAEQQQKLQEQIRQFDASLEENRKKLQFEQQKHKDDVALKRQALNKPSTSK